MMAERSEDPKIRAFFNRHQSAFVAIATVMERWAGDPWLLVAVNWIKRDPAGTFRRKGGSWRRDWRHDEVGGGVAFEDLCRRCGVPPGDLRRVLKGLAELPIKFVCALARGGTTSIESEWAGNGMGQRRKMISYIARTRAACQGSGRPRRPCTT